jgi:hypothetical protein
MRAGAGGAREGRRERRRGVAHEARRGAAAAIGRGGGVAGGVGALRQGAEADGDAQVARGSLQERCESEAFDHHRLTTTV